MRVISDEDVQTIHRFLHWTKQQIMKDMKSYEPNCTGLYKESSRRLIKRLDELLKKF